MLRTRICDLLGIEVPIMVAPMGFITRAELAAAVSNAGGLGIMAAGRLPAPSLREEIHRLRSMTDRPFGINMLLHFPQEENVGVCIEEKVPVVSFYWGDPSPYVERVHKAGLLVFDQVGSVKSAERSVRAGVDVIIAQGVEAGGHVAGQVTTMVLVPRVVQAIAPVPVIAAGGIADARGVVAALALGADGVVLGTRFLATPEAAAHPAYKQKIVAASEEDTIRTILFGHGWPHAPHRVLRTPFVEQWLEQEARAQESRADEPVIGETCVGGKPVPLRRFMSIPPTFEATGEIDSMAFYAGQVVGLVREIQPAATIVRELVEGARQIIEHLLQGVVTPARG